MSTLFRDISRKIRAPFNNKSAFLEMEKFHASQRNIEEIVDAAIKFPSKGLFRIESVQKRSDNLALARAVAELKPSVDVPEYIDDVEKTGFGIGLIKV
jgi:hypothetical protein